MLSKLIASVNINDLFSNNNTTTLKLFNQMKLIIWYIILFARLLENDQNFHQRNQTAFLNIFHIPIFIFPFLLHNMISSCSAVAPRQTLTNHRATDPSSQ